MLAIYFIFYIYCKLVLKSPSGETNKLIVLCCKFLIVINMLADINKFGYLHVFLVAFLGSKPKVASLRVFGDISSYSGVTYSIILCRFYLF